MYFDLIPSERITQINIPHKTITILCSGEMKLKELRLYTEEFVWHLWDIYEIITYTDIMLVLTTTIMYAWIGHLHFMRSSIRALAHRRTPEKVQAMRSLKSYTDGGVFQINIELEILSCALNPLVMVPNGYIHQNWQMASPEENSRSYNFMK